MITSLTNRITAGFGVLMLGTMSILFALWYFGLPRIDLVGADSLHLVEAMRLLEVKADLQRTWIANGLVTRRGDVLILAENKVLAQQLEQRDKATQQDVERLFHRLQRAYPDRYRRLLIVDPDNVRILASDAQRELGLPYRDPLLIERAAQPGTTELVEQLSTPERASELAIVRQIHVLDSDGYPHGKLVGILIVIVDLQQMVGQNLRAEMPILNMHETTLLFDAGGQLLPLVPGTAPDGFKLGNQVTRGFEGTLLQTDASGRELIVVYRHLQLSGTQGWTIVHYASKKDALAGLEGRAKKLFFIGLLLTLAMLVLISLVARTLTRPLQSLSEIARRLGAGDLTARTVVGPRASGEIATLSDAINWMADSVQKAHHTLEAKVQERTAELSHERDRAQGYLDIAGIMLMALDRTGRIAMINRKGAQLLAQQESALLGVDWFQHFIPAEKRADARRSYAYMMGPGAPQTEHCENHIINASGQQLLLAWNSTLLRNDAGDVVGALFSAEDISARMQAEAALRIAATAFEAQEGMFITDTARAILQVNHAFTEITGYTQQEAVGCDPRLLNSGRHDAAFFAAMTASIERDGTWHGEIWNRRKSGEIYPEWLTITAVKDDAGLTTNYVATFTDITLRKAAEDEIRNLAFYDPLTGLPNRRLLMDRLELALVASARHHRKGALLFVDLDNFKTLNDTLGHDKGDLLLQQVANRLLSCTREGDTVARLGGDEFVVMLEDLSENALAAVNHVEAVGKKILAMLDQPYQFTDCAHQSSASIGATLFGEHQETIDEPLKRADMAMYQAKAAGRNNVRFFDPQMQAVVTARATLEAGLRDALEHDQFLLYYQPQVMGERQITGAEILLRWQHPQQGIVAPAEFIALAEETGLILPLGHWVLDSACMQLAIWDSRIEMADFTLTVNVSARQFHQADFVDQVLAVLEQRGANPRRLKLELTEGLLISNVEDVIAKMNALKEKGVGFSLDDFGTGYSSLSYLKRLPLDQLKIDQSFIKDILIDPNDAAIARVIVALAGSLGLAVIAEGVETEAQRSFLALHACHCYQGYLFSPPLPLDEFEALVQQGLAGPQPPTLH
jgi:diguanylate cyclase (GGDEF)-like protein/PAS domain S-box-containing protein